MNQVITLGTLDTDNQEANSDLLLNQVKMNNPLDIRIIILRLRLNLEVIFKAQRDFNLDSAACDANQDIRLI